MKTFKYFFLHSVYVSVLLLIFSCDPPVQQKITFKGTALGTYYTIHYYSAEKKKMQDYRKQQIDSLLTEFNNTASIYVPNSVISKINRNEDFQINKMFLDIYNTSFKISEISSGAFDITVGPLVDAWGFGASKEPQKKFNTDSILPYVGYKKVTIQGNIFIKEDPRIQLNMNAVAKGYAVDLVAKYFEQNNILSYIVEIGGEIRVGNRKPDGSLWTVAVEKPTESSTDQQQEGQLLSVENVAVATSGSYRQYYENEGHRYSHEIDPATGQPVINSMLSSTIIAGDCATADALATACMVLGVEKSIELCDKMENVEGYFICDNKKGGWAISSTTGFEKYFRKE